MFSDFSVRQLADVLLAPAFSVMYIADIFRLALHVIKRLTDRLTVRMAFFPVLAKQRRRQINDN